MSILYSLKIPQGQLRAYCDRYNYKQASHDAIEDYYALGPQQGYLTREQLHEICYWKSTRRAAAALLNTSAFVEEITRFAFCAKCEESRIGSLTLLEGVFYPTASVILHFCVDPSYPILDQRALWTLSIPKPSVYTTQFWLDYVALCRKLAADNGMTVRELDKALWQYSLEHQDGLSVA